jgi:DNA-binding transcriptional ArsR family regulator
MSEAATGLAAAVAVEADDDDLSELDLSGVFELLSDETRLGIVRELAAVNADETTGNSRSFSELRTRVGTRDSGQFNYHLGRLRGSLVEKTAAGYELTELGLVVGATVLDATATE